MYSSSKELLLHFCKYEAGGTCISTSFGSSAQLPVQMFHMVIHVIQVCEGNRREYQFCGKAESCFFNSTGSRNTSWATRCPFQPTFQNSSNSCSTCSLQLYVLAKPAHNPGWAIRGTTQPWGNTQFSQNTPPVHGLTQTTTRRAIILSPRAVLATISVSAEVICQQSSGCLLTLAADTWKQNIPSSTGKLQQASSAIVLQRSVYLTSLKTAS